MSLWPGAHLPNLNGKIAIITGANSGIGFYSALELARAGATVILACRNTQKGEKAAALINEKAPDRAIFMPLDLADFAAVHEFAGNFKERYGALDLLINNAGIMAPPQRLLTAQGLELQFGVNFIGHFLLTALLLTPLLDARAPRVIQLSSVAHRRGRIDFADLQSVRAYRGWTAYAQSKLAMLVFAQELARRADAGGWGILSLAAHPGVAATELVDNGPGPASAMAWLLKLASPLVRQSATAGAWPILLAATDPYAQPGAYYGPQGLFEFRGRPGIAKIEPAAFNPQTGAQLWEEAERLTGESFKPAP